MCDLPFNFQRHTRTTDVLLRDVVADWLPCFSSHQRASLFDAFFLDVEPTAALPVLIAALSWTEYVRVTAVRPLNLSTGADLLWFVA